MNLPRLTRKLIQAARSQPPADSVPYGFEQRIMARIRAAKPMDAWAAWSAALWRAAFACLALTVLSSAWTLWIGQRGGTQLGFAEEFESAVVASELHLDETW